MSRLRLFLPLVLLVAASLELAAQIVIAPRGGPMHTGNWVFDIGAQMAQPVGDFAMQIERAWGIGGSVKYRLPRASAIALRGDAAWLNYGNERKSVPLSTSINRVFVDMNTANNIAVFSAGPELSVPKGPVRPYAFAFAGYSYFYTSTSVGDDDGGSAFAQSTNYDDGGFASGWGGGVRMPIVVRSAEVAVDLGGRMTRNGVRSYLRRGDIIDQPNGSFSVSPRTTVADFWQYHVGISIAPRFR